MDHSKGNMEAQRECTQVNKKYTAHRQAGRDREPSARGTDRETRGKVSRSAGNRKTCLKAGDGAAPSESGRPHALGRWAARAREGAGLH